LGEYPDTLSACWQTRRKDTSEDSKVSRFSVSDAKVAGLWGKRGPWVQYPRRMLVCRARAWGLRDNYSDALQGISQAEEWADMKLSRPVDALDVAAAPTEPEAPETPPPAAPSKPDAANLEKFRGRVHGRRSGETDLDDAAWIAGVCVRAFKKPTLEDLTLDEFNALCLALKDGRYDWATGEPIPREPPTTDDPATWPKAEDGEPIPPEAPTDTE
jgi:hypothetical protein